MHPVSNVKFTDQNGLAYGVKQVDGKMRSSVTPYLYDIAEGLVPGHAPFKKMGYNGAVGATEEDIWENGGVYTPPAAATGMEVISTSANDILGGSGIQTVTLYYLTNAFVEKSETINMNGLAVRLTAGVDIYRVNYLIASSVGIGGVAAGTITLRTAGGGTTYAIISQGYTQARNLFYTVPTLKAIFITSILLSTGSSNASRVVRFTARATYDRIASASRNFYLPFDETVIQDSPYQLDLDDPIKFPAGTDVKVSAISPDGDTICTADINGWIEVV